MKKLLLILIVLFLSSFAKGQNNSTKTFCDSISDGSIHFQIVSEVPRYPGGPKEMDQFIYDNFKLSINASILKSQIHAIIHFDSKGHIRNACVFKNYYKVKTNIGSTPIGIEILRVIWLMPDWTPAKQNDKKISVNFVVPINLNR